MNSIRSHLALRLLIGFVLLLGMACGLAYFILQKIIKDDFDERLFAKAQAVVASTTQSGRKLDIDWQDLPKELGTRKRPPTFVQFLDESGQPWGGKAFIDLKTFPILAKQSYRDAISLDGQKLRVLTLPFQPLIEENDVEKTPPEIRKNCILMVGNDRTQLDRSLFQIAIVLIATTVVTSTLGVCLVFFVLRRGLRPLAKLSQEVAQIDAASLETKIKLDSLPTELMPIAEKLNDLLGRLEVSFVRERQFSANVSHELRTPITELRILSEIMLRQPELPEENRKAFQEVLEASCQMESMVVALLEIVRSERNISVLKIAQVNLPELILYSFNAYRSKAEQKGLQGSFNLPDQLLVETDHRLLQLVFNNLFSNAVNYTPEGGIIDVSAFDHEGQQIIAVQNSSEDISPEDLAHFFERFWRKDQVRGRDEHFGLGLSLVQVICQRLQIDLTVSISTENLVCFCLGFPRAEVI
jgi:signal transduction histidine kinase/uncharacterized protein YneF (UPF0154 family)